MVRCGLIGIGHHGQRYLSALLSPDSLGRLVAVACEDATKQDTTLPLGVKRFNGYLDLIADPDVAAVIAVVPPRLHPAICAASFRARKPLLLEKPLAQTAAVARDIATHAKEVGARLMVAHTLRFDPVTRALKENIHLAGDTILISVSQRFKPASASWWDEPGTLGTPLLVGVHGFDMVQWLCDSRILQVLSAQSRVVAQNTADSFVAICRVARSNVVGVVDGTRASSGRLERVEVVGTNGLLVADVTVGTLTHVRDRHRDVANISNGESQVPACLRAFLRCIEQDKDFPISIDDALAAVEVAEACATSHNLQVAVPL